MAVHLEWYEYARPLSDGVIESSDNIYNAEEQEAACRWLHRRFMSAQLQKLFGYSAWHLMRAASSLKHTYAHSAVSRAILKDFAARQAGAMKAPKKLTNELQ